MDNSWLSLLPSVITIIVAIWSKKILPSLLLGLLVGSYLLNPTLIGGIETAIENITKVLTDKDNLEILVFLYLFSGLISLIKKAGGIEGFSNFASKYIKSEKGVFYILWGLIPVTFIDCDFRIVGAGSIIRSLAEKNKVARERIAFSLNNTASPIIELIPIATTFVGFNVANIGQGLKVAGVQAQHSAYSTLLHAIPFEFFSIMVLLITFGTIFFQWKKPAAENQMPEMHGKNSCGMMGVDMKMEEEVSEIKPHLINLIIPMVTVIFLSFFFYWHFGKANGGTGTVSSIITATEPNKAMLVALFISIMLTGIVYFFQKYSVKKMTNDIISGGNNIMGIIVILVVAWALGDVSQDLNLSSFIQHQLGTSLPVWSIPLSLFILASIITYFIGEGWATSSLIMPFAISLAVSSGAGIPICVAAVITGGTFGDVTSPVAGMTNMASGIARVDQMKYLKYTNPYNFTALALAALLFLVFGYIR